MSEYNKNIKYLLKKLKGGTKENYVNFNAENILINENKALVWRLDSAAELTAGEKNRAGRQFLSLFSVSVYMRAHAHARCGIPSLFFKKKKK